MQKELIKIFGVAFVVVCFLFMLSSPALAQEEPPTEPPEEPTGTATSVDSEGNVTEWTAEGSLSIADEEKGLVNGTLTFTTTDEAGAETVCDVAFSGVLVSGEAGSLLKGTIGSAADETEPPPENGEPQAEHTCGIYGIFDAVAIAGFAQGLARDTDNNQTIIFQLPIDDGEEPPTEPEEPPTEPEEPPTEPEEPPTEPEEPPAE